MTIKIKTILKRLLSEHNCTAAQLARSTSVPPQTINNWLSGQMPGNLDQLKAIADHFKVSLDFLVYGDENRQKIFESYRDEINAGTFEVILRKTQRNPPH